MKTRRYGRGTRTAEERQAETKADGHVGPGHHEMVAYSGEARAVLCDVLRDNLSPQAVAVLVARLVAGKTPEAEVDRELTWFTNVLVAEVLGGPEALDRLAKEAGL